MTSKNLSQLESGHTIPAAYENPSLEQKRVAAIDKMGRRWLMHPLNRVRRGGLPFGTPGLSCIPVLSRVHEDFKK